MGIYYGGFLKKVLIVEIKLCFFKNKQYRFFFKLIIIRFYYYIYDIDNIDDKFLFFLENVYGGKIEYNQFFCRFI